MTRYRRLIYNFLSAGIRGSLINEDIRRVTLINLFAVCGIFYLLFYSHRMYILDGANMLSYIYLYCVLVIVLMQIYLRFRKKILFVSHVLVVGLFCLEIFFLNRNGNTRLNLSSYYIFPGIYWYYIFPPFSLFMLGRKIGSIYNIALIGFTIVFFSFHQFANELYDTEFEVRLLSIFSAVFFFSYFFESIRSITFDAYEVTRKKNIKYLSVISSKNSNLNKTNKELSQVTEEIKTQMEYLKVLNNELVEQNEKIASQNNLLELQSQEIVSQRDLLIQHKQNIDDSILYASYIQNALLPSDELLKEHFLDHFILYKPRNVIGGDFYFIKKIGNNLIVAGADCTGHGVPGAMLSMLGIASLSEIVYRREINSTSMVLSEMRREVTNILCRKDTIYDARDGMDISLCKINLSTLELEFSGAYNPVYIIRGNELMYLKADKIQVGDSITHGRVFTSQTLQLQKNDCLYLFSDGFTDQLGGQSRKKYMAKNFQDLLIKIAQDKMATQKKVLLHTLDQWRGNYDQTDDVMIIGIRI